MRINNREFCGLLSLLVVSLMAAAITGLWPLAIAMVSLFALGNCESKEACEATDEFLAAFNRAAALASCRSEEEASAFVEAFVTDYPRVRLSK